MKKELLLSALAAILVATCFGTTAANADNAETETDIKTNRKAEESTEIKADEKIELSAKERNEDTNCRRCILMCTVRDNLSP